MFLLPEGKAPIISLQEQIMDGDILQANCSIIHSCPSSPPSLHWSKSQFLKNSTIMAFSQEMQGQWLYTETLQGRATYEMHHSNITCSAQFSRFTKKSRLKTLNMLCKWNRFPIWIHTLPRNCLSILVVNYDFLHPDKPVTVTLKLAKKPVTEGSSVTVECAANCNPPPHTYTWLRREMGQITKITSTPSRKPFINITRDTFILCIAHNDIGEGQSDWLDLDVQCKYILHSISSTTPEVTDIISTHPGIQCLTFTQKRCCPGYWTEPLMKFKAAACSLISHYKLTNYNN